MKKCISMLIFLGFGVGFVASCQSPKQTNNDVIPSSPTVVSKPISAIQCNDPRRKACTKEYRPVCATRDTGVRCVTTPCSSTELVTKGNACTACADEKVSSYVPGACS